MKAAFVMGPEQEPAYGDFPDPVASEGEQVIRVTAAAISPLVRSRASGTHYDSPHQYPSVIGVDGVGRLENGRRVYFALPRPPYGAFSEHTVVRVGQCIPIPKSLDDVTAAAIANPGMSSVVAFTERAHLRRGEVVLVNGATGTAGRLAVQIAKHAKASKVIATGRNPESLRDLSALGADVVIPLEEDKSHLEARFHEQFAQGVNVVIDYVWGSSAETLLIAAAKAQPEAMPVRFVSVGSMSGPAITLPSAILRSSAIQLMGSGIGSVPRRRIGVAIYHLFRIVKPAGLRIATKSVPLAEFRSAWVERDSTRRVVLTVGS